MGVTAIPIVIILIKKYVTQNNTTILQGSWKKGGVTIFYHKYSGWERGERYSLLSVYVCMSVYKCMYVYMVVWPHSSFFFTGQFFFRFAIL